MRSLRLVLVTFIKESNSLPAAIEPGQAMGAKASKRQVIKRFVINQRKEKGLATRPGALRRVLKTAIHRYFILNAAYLTINMA
jgi:hypothetical protein